MSLRRRLVALVLNALLIYRPIGSGETVCTMAHEPAAREHAAHLATVAQPSSHRDHHGVDHDGVDACDVMCMPGACTATHCNASGEIARAPSDFADSARRGPTPAHDSALSSVIRAPDPPPPRL